eukprot:1658078-Rhodomonas_salina.1
MQMLLGEDKTEGEREDKAELVAVTQQSMRTRLMMLTSEADTAELVAPLLRRAHPQMRMMSGADKA